MVGTKLPSYFVALSAPLLLEVVMIPSLLTAAQAQTPSSAFNMSLEPRSEQIAPTTTINGGKRAVEFKPRSDIPAPKDSIGGGRRNDGKCPQERKASDSSAESLSNQSLTPLVPSSRSLHLTVSAHPTLMVYVPQTSAKSMRLRLEQDGNAIYQTTMNLTATPGIVSISLPTTAPALQPGQNYKWLVSMVCEAEDPENPFVEGVLRRIQPETALQSQLQKADSLEKVALYAENGIWHDAVAELAVLRKSQPSNSDVTSAWEDLLRSADLDALVNAPLKN